MKTPSIIDYIKNTNHEIILQESIEFFTVGEYDETSFMITNSDMTESKILDYSILDDLIINEEGWYYSDNLHKEFGVNPFLLDLCEELDQSETVKSGNDLD